MGTATPSLQALPAPPTGPDPIDQLIASRKAALRTLAAKRGLQSTFTTTPRPPTALGNYGPLSASGNGGA